MTVPQYCNGRRGSGNGKTGERVKRNKQGKSKQTKNPVKSPVNMEKLLERTSVGRTGYSINNCAIHLRSNAYLVGLKDFLPQ